ncbi:hypothetical protein COV13_00705 [Candidatus Woesearchaeota archaeon CG10_big_fil_rev_8_21_14_0_10_32_9]|nr:MAG: hypothetical protein COV13_00705 [Candidatus Woesearchaeota archaeon CG10_big_fil_rev_8_21_14_0_10_32_9]
MKKFDWNYELKITYEFFRKTLDKLAYPGILLILTVFSIIKLLIPFWKYNNLYTWDLAGQLFSTWFLKEYLYPGIVGWNPFFFAGFPQNQFYTPLFSYISATLSFIFSIETSIKIVLSIVILLTPVSIYYFLRSLKISKQKSSLLTLISYSAFYFVRPEFNHFGGDFFSTFNVGLFTNALGLILAFFYLGTLIRGLDNKKFVLASVLFSLLIISHIFSAVFGLIVGGSFILFRTLKDKKMFKFGVKHYLLTFGLTAFWVLPFLFKINNTVTVKAFMNPFLFYIILGCSLILIFGAYINKKEANMEIAFVSAILSLFVLILYHFTNLPFHHYRLLFLSLVLFILLVFSWFKEENIFIYGFLACAIIFSLIAFPNIDTSGNADITVNIQNSTFEPTERLYIIANQNEQTDLHVLQHKIPMDYKINGIKGLYVESSPTSVFISYLEKELDESSMVWGAFIDNKMWKNKTIIQEILPYQLKYLNIDKIISTENKTGIGTKIQNITTTITTKTSSTTYNDFYLYKLEKTNLIEPLNYSPRVVKGDWMNASVNWFMSEDIKNGIIAFEDVPDFVGTGSEKVTIQNISELNDKIDFYVDSDKAVPLLIKISYFPNWKAYSAGKALKTYRVSPNMILIYGKGEINLRYEPLFIDKISSIISIITLLWILYYIYRFNLKK